MGIFTTIIVRPIFNLLVIIYNYLPGHDFGIAIIIFTALIRLALWPLMKKQLHQMKVMRKLQPEMKRIKQETKGDKQKEARLMQELYKEQGINPFGSIGVLILQLPILIGLYEGLRRIINDPHQIVSFPYSGVEHLGWIQHIAHNIHDFHATLFGVVDLTRSAASSHGFYWPAFILVLLAAILTYYQSKQMQPTDKNARKLRDIIKASGQGKQADQSEMNAAIGRSTRYFLPAILFIFMIQYTSAISLYILTSSLVAYLQQLYILREDTEDMEKLADKKSRKKSSGADANSSGKGAIIEGELAEKSDKPAPKPEKPKPQKPSKKSAKQPAKSQASKSASSKPPASLARPKAYSKTGGKKKRKKR